MAGERGRTLSESQWIRKAQAGDAEAFRKLVELHGAVIWSVIHRIAPDPSSREDLFQESIIRFWRGLPSFKGGSKLTTWLYKIVYRVCIDSLRESSRHKPWITLNEQLEVTGNLPEDDECSGRQIENDVEARDSIQKALNYLHPEWRGMVILYYWRGLSTEEIARITNHPVNTVKVYLHRARGVLREVLKKQEYPGRPVHKD